MINDNVNTQNIIGHKNNSKAARRDGIPFMVKITTLSLTLVTALLQPCPVAAQEDNDTPAYNDEILMDNGSGQYVAGYPMSDNNGTGMTDSDIIMLPEALMQDVDSMLRLYYSKTYLVIDDNCNYTDVNPTFSDETYIERLSRLPNIMEMPYNSVVRNAIDRYSGRMRKAVSFWLGASNFYTPIFEQALEAYGMPLELKYLPVIESGLNPNAVSRAGATGLWQFMLNTGKQYGLTVNSLVDERRDPVKASYAAAQYLRDLYKIFGDWNLVIAAYNCGPENINKAIHRAGGEKDYWKIYPYLPRETQGYVPSFIAANYIMNYYCEHNICPLRTKLPVRTDTVVVTKDVHLQQIAAVCDVSLDELRALNPQYRRDIVNGLAGPAVIRLPESAVNTFIDNEDSIYAYNSDVLLTKRSEVDVPKASTTSKGKSKKSKRGRKTVTVRKGDTLSQIAARYGTTVAKLRRLNGLRSNTIRVGSKLRVR